MTYQKLIEEIKTIVNSNHQGNRNLQVRFDNAITKLKGYDITGIRREFLYFDKKMPLSVRQRVGRLLRKSKVLRAVGYTYIKTNTTINFHLRKFAEHGNFKGMAFYLYRLSDRGHIRKSTIWLIDHKF